MSRAPRHPSAGNLATRPTAVSDPIAPEPVPHLAFPFGLDPGDLPEVGVGVVMGPGLDTDTTSRLIGSLDGKRVLELGCGTGANAVAMTRAGARVIVVEPILRRLAEARALAEVAEVKIEFHHGDFADLAFVRGDQVDLAISSYGLVATEDLGRVFRQVHRVLRSEAPLVISLPHPAAIGHQFEGGGGPMMIRTQFDATTVSWESDDQSGVIIPQRLADVFTMLTRSDFRVDTLLEPMALETAAGPYWTPLGEWMPLSVIYRGRKLGV